MPKLIPVPDEVDKPFWDGVNQKKLLLQVCDKGHEQYPPKQRCFDCGSTTFTWKEAKGRGHVSCGITVEDTRLDRWKGDQPFNIALITLDENPKINFYSNLPGIKPFEIPIGAAVELIFEEVAPGQLVHEWKVIK
jgi:uncharacterized OB-fold protein